MYNNTFNVNDYFTVNFGLGDRPATAKMKVGMIVGGAILAVFGIIMLAVLVKFSAIAAVIIGIVFLGIAALLITLAVVKFVKAKGRVKEWEDAYNYRYTHWDEELEAFYEKTLEEMNLKQAGMNKIGIDEALLEEAGVAPFSIHGQLYEGWYRFGADGEIRTDDRQVTWLFFSKDQIYVYDITFSLTGRKKKVENTQEFFYTDIVSVSTGSVSKALPSSNSAGGGNAETIEAEEFRLVVPGDKISFAFTSNETITRSIQAMKNTIREKKNG